jgi:hypothetical protein
MRERRPLDLLVTPIFHMNMHLIIRLIMPILLHIFTTIFLQKGAFMPSVQSTNKKERLSFFVNQELSDKIYKISKQTKLTISEIARNALQNYIEQIEKEKIENELEAGYKANYSYYLKSQEEWKYADKE